MVLLALGLTIVFNIYIIPTEAILRNLKKRIDLNFCLIL
jgi:hypothetical protein